jgi:hypothetical protein
LLGIERGKPGIACGVGRRLGHRSVAWSDRLGPVPANQSPGQGLQSARAGADMQTLRNGIPVSHVLAHILIGEPVTHFAGICAVAFDGFD